MTRPYPAAIGIAVASIIVICLILPPLGWHIRNKNVGASAVISWIILLNLIIFVNAIIWPDDDFTNSFKGQGLCDIEAKIQVASQVALPASFACILRALAAVLNIKKLTVTKTDKRKNLLIDLLWCVGFPALQMILHYIVQPNRYFIFGISGCVPSITSDWVSFVIILMPPVIWTLICAIYAVIIVMRLFRYRQSFRQTLINNDTNKSRFMRLYALCLLWILANVPVQCFVFYISFSAPRYDYSWSDTHDADYWKIISMTPSNGIVLYDRYIWLSTGIAMFLFFGIGREALQIYQEGVKAFSCTCCKKRRCHSASPKHTAPRTYNSASSNSYMLRERKTLTETVTSCGSEDIERREFEHV